MDQDMIWYTVLKKPICFVFDDSCSVEFHSSETGALFAFWYLWQKFFQTVDTYSIVIMRLNSLLLFWITLILIFRSKHSWLFCLEVLNSLANTNHLFFFLLFFLWLVCWLVSFMFEMFNFGLYSLWGSCHDLEKICKSFPLLYRPPRWPSG